MEQLPPLEQVQEGAVEKVAPEVNPQEIITAGLSQIMQSNNIQEIKTIAQSLLEASQGAAPVVEEEVDPGFRDQAMEALQGGA